MVGVLVKSVSYVEESPTILATIVCGIDLFSQANHWAEITKNWLTLKDTCHQDAQKHVDYKDTCLRQHILAIGV